MELNDMVLKRQAENALLKQRFDRLLKAAKETDAAWCEGSILALGMSVDHLRQVIEEVS